jgi:hypothetical protein
MKNKIFWKGLNYIKPQAQPAFALVPESTILIGYCQSKQRQWVEKKGLYNIRLDNIGQKEKSVLCKGLS